MIRGLSAFDIKVFTYKIPPDRDGYALISFEVEAWYFNQNFVDLVIRGTKTNVAYGRRAIHPISDSPGCYSNSIVCYCNGSVFSIIALEPTKVDNFPSIISINTQKKSVYAALIRAVAIPMIDLIKVEVNVKLSHLKRIKRPGFEWKIH